MKKITVLFFGKLKQCWNTGSIEVATDAKNIESLYAQLLQKIEHHPHKVSIQVAINDEFVDWNSLINDGDTIAFLPPASGG